MISWFTRNGIAANFLMVGIFLAGIYTAFFKIPLEVTPALSWNLVMMDMRYRGATPVSYTHLTLPTIYSV